MGDLVATIVEHIIDCDAQPFVPNGWEVEEHKKGGQLKLDLSKVRLYLSPNQTGDKVIQGNYLRGELTTKSVLNANVLDYLLAHPELIPEDWKKDDKGNTRYIFFWGTIYRHSCDGGRDVRFLYFHDKAWRSGKDWLGGDSWCGNSPAAVLES